MNKITRSVFAGIAAWVLAGCAGAVSQPQGLQEPRSAAQPIPKQPSQQLWNPETFLAQPNGNTGPLMAYDMATGTEKFALPAGLLSAGGKQYFASQLIGDNDTKINSYNMQTGEERLCLKLEGRWRLAGISPNGKYVAVMRLASEEERARWAKAGTWHTEMQVINTGSWRAEHQLTLEGNFEVETISADGQSLFLVQHLPAINPDHYLIRLYDLSQESLLADPLRSKGGDEVMTGYAWDGVASTDGQWLLTLYINTHKNQAFVHTLSLTNKFPLCIDLPSGDGAVEALKQYRLTVSADSKRLYAANTALGVVVEINLDAGSESVYQILHTTHFEMQKTQNVGADAQRTHSAFSADGNVLYFGNANQVWAYDVSTRKAKSFEAAGRISGLGASSDGQRVYVAREAAPVLVLDAVRGTVLSFPVASNK